MNVRFRVGRVNACVSEDEAHHLAAHLLERSTRPALSVAVKIIGAIEAGRVKDAA